MSVWPEGLVTPLATPFDADGLNEQALGQLLDFQVESGAEGVVVAGGCGEFGALTVDERKQLAVATVSLLEGRLPVIVQTGALTTGEAIELSAHAEEVGAAAVLLASPFGDPITWGERKRFYERVDDAITLPMMVYNTPTSGHLTFDQIKELAALSNVGAIKFSSGDVTLMGDLLTWSGEHDFAVYLGFDSILPFAATGGARGAVIGTGNAVPKEIVEIWRLCRAGDKGAELAAKWPYLREFMRYVEREEVRTNYIGLFKAGLSRRGIQMGEVREPFLMPGRDEEEAYLEQLDAVARAFGLETPGEGSAEVRRG